MNPVGIDAELLDMMQTVLTKHRAAQERRDPAQLDHPLWAKLEDLGLTRLTGAEPAGGSGATWLEAGALLRLTAATAAAVPLAEHDLLAGWLLERAGLPVPREPMTVAVLGPGDTATDVPWVTAGSALVLAREPGEGRQAVAIVPATQASVGYGSNLAGAPRASVSVDATAVSWTPVEGDIRTGLFRRGALARSLQICGALDKIVELSVSHTAERVQFGRPLAKFQAVQHLVADAAAEAALARVATDAALAEAAAAGFEGQPIGFAIAVARSCAGHAVSTVVRNAHQVHGAIGTTIEHELHEFTKPALAWRSEFGTTRYFDDYLTEVAVRAGRQVWPVVTGGSRWPLP